MTLQWGRNFIVAEIAANKHNAVRIYKLQWGRNFIVAEIDTRGGSARTPTASFNGAATLSLRKSTNPLDEFENVSVLQWGRNFIVAEMAPWGR